MKIRCDACERVEAAVLCCADEAALCWDCDVTIHSANKLAGKHQRVLLQPPSDPSSPSSNPICDICQEKAGYFFCLEDRALLCRNCDVPVHTTSPYMSSHKRFLITGIRVGLQQHIPNNDGSITNSTGISSSTSGNGSNIIPNSMASSNFLADKEHSTDAMMSIAVDDAEDFEQQWPWNEMFDNVNFEQCYGLSEPGPSSLTG